MEVSVAVRRSLLALAVLGAASLASTQATVVRDVVVRGNENISTEAVLAAMQSKPGRPFSQAELEEDRQAILDLGLFSAVQLFSSLPDGNQVDVIVEVEENPVIREVSITGNTIIDDETLTGLVLQHQQMGLVYNNRNARPIADSITELYTEEDYIVQIDELGPSPDSPNTLAVELIEARVESIEITGLTRTDPDVIDRILQTDPGDPLSPGRWRADMEELYSTYWFESIQPLAPEPVPNKPGYYTLPVEVVEARTGQIQAGVALDSNGQLIGTLNYNDSNFRGMGQSVGVFLSQATVGGGPSAEVAYGNRFFDDKGTALQASLYSKIVYNFSGGGFSNFDSPDDDRFDQRRTGGNVSLTRRLDDTLRASIGLRGETMTTLGIADDQDDTGFIQQDGDILSLTLGIERNTTAPLLDPVRGQKVSLVLEPGYSNITSIGGELSQFDNLLGESFFLKSTVEYKQYWSRAPAPDEPIDAPRPVLAARARYSRIEGTVPFFEQIFIGGSNSLRGYANQRFWGSESLLTTVEYRYPIQKAFNIIGFVDWGGAWGGYGEVNDFSQSSTFNMHLGYGVGVSFRTPLGPIRIDLGINEDGNTRTHFSFGSSF